ncbi:hypothetical protein PHAVU_008G080700 [Phaseolus vulgaris]|uniref:Uncharacterized protein n=1 Tax=Phaseolus vulgaris TaxID=3885 RepID=V7B2I8_PHAVU|nr:hypothetical protein PHAVU_008G080700g [Phaseolus vulgaris]ESW12049.1 hypothetical protein PHAVU_008G080700g [Phaseolus vulgaris]
MKYEQNGSQAYSHISVLLPRFTVFSSPGISLLYYHQTPCSHLITIIYFFKVQSINIVIFQSKSLIIINRKVP